MKNDTKKLLLILAALILTLVYGSTKGWLPQIENKSPTLNQLPKKASVVSEESAMISAIEKARPSVVTVAISTTSRSQDRIQINPFDPFNPFRRIPGESRQIEQNIGSGFVVSRDGLVVTNKHVVNNTDAAYKIITDDGKEHKVTDISRDPLNDLAILKTEVGGVAPLEIGDSGNLKLGQVVIAIGTPLGEFTNTVTAGIISGLKRGIVAGSPFESHVEQLDNVIQTDAAISPGNSGGPLINLSGQAIGVNTAISSQGQNIGFAIPINVVTNLMKNYNQSSGQIERPFLGVRYQAIERKNAILNEIPEGALVIEVVEGSPADKAGITPEDIITEIDGQRIKGKDDKTLQKVIALKKIGDKIKLKVYRNNKTIDITVTLSAFE